MENVDIKFSYETLWKFIIRPPRDDYTESTLGSPSFHFNSKTYIRRDYDIMSTEGYILKCSLIEPKKAYRPSVKMPVVIYLHGNSSSRIEGLNMAKVLLRKNINLFVFDFAGSGLSEGEYVSLGYHESNDLENVIDFLEKIPGVGKIGIWGRSMGAATGMLYAHRDKRIRAICLDSPFADFERLAKELTKKHLSFNLPGFILSGMLSIVRGTILKKNGLDIDKLKPIEYASKTTQPIIFVHAINDELIDVKHSMDLFNNYAGQEKSLKCCETGGHNSKRSSNIIKDIVDFFEKHLCTHGEKRRIDNNNININMNYNFNKNNNNIHNLNNNNINKFNSSNSMNIIQEEEEIIVNESQISVNEIKEMNPKLQEDKNDGNIESEEDPFDEKNTERIQYAKKREKMDKQRLSDMVTLFKSIKPDIKNSFENNNNNSNNNNLNNNIDNNKNKMNLNFNQPKMNNNNNLNNNMINLNNMNSNFNGNNNNKDNVKSNFYDNFNNNNDNNVNNNNINRENSHANRYLSFMYDIY